MLRSHSYGTDHLQYDYSTRLGYHNPRNKSKIIIIMMAYLLFLGLCFKVFITRMMFRSTMKIAASAAPTPTNATGVTDALSSTLGMMCRNGHC